jgi:hypothetical protein
MNTWNQTRANIASLFPDTSFRICSQAAQTDLQSKLLKFDNIYIYTFYNINFQQLGNTAPKTALHQATHFDA